MRKPKVWKQGGSWWVMYPEKRRWPSPWSSELLGRIEAMHTWDGAIGMALLWSYAEYVLGDGSRIWRRKRGE